jgi:hypothetical protein
MRTLDPAVILQNSTVPGTDVLIQVYVNADLRYVARVQSVSGLVPDVEIQRSTEPAARETANVLWVVAQAARDTQHRSQPEPTQTESWTPFEQASNYGINPETGLSWPSPAPAPVEITEGFWSLGERIFKVQSSQTSGHLYAKELTSDGWSYLPGGATLLATQGASRLTAETAERYGKLYGVCAICGRTLTNEESIERGIGPVCAGRMGW